jgi:hypothetical protein
VWDVCGLWFVVLSEKRNEDRVMEERGAMGVGCLVLLRLFCDQELLPASRRRPLWACVIRRCHAAAGEAFEYVEDGHPHAEGPLF